MRGLRVHTHAGPGDDRGYRQAGGPQPAVEFEGEDPAEAFSLYLRSALALQLEDGGLQAVLLSPADESAEVKSAKQEIFATFSAVLDRAQAAGAVRGGVTLEQLSHLVCGVEYAVRLGSPDDRAPLLEILLSGLRPAA